MRDPPTNAAVRTRKALCFQLQGQLCGVVTALVPSLSQVVDVAIGLAGIMKHSFYDFTGSWCSLFERGVAKGANRRKRQGSPRASSARLNPHRTCRDTVSRSIPSTGAIHRWDHPSVAFARNLTWNPAGGSLAQIRHACGQAGAHAPRSGNQGAILSGGGTHESFPSANHHLPSHSSLSSTTQFST